MLKAASVFLGRFTVDSQCNELFRKKPMTFIRLFSDRAPFRRQMKMKIPAHGEKSMLGKNGHGMAYARPGNPQVARDIDGMDVAQLFLEDK